MKYCYFAALIDVFMKDSVVMTENALLNLHLHSTQWSFIASLAPLLMVV